MLTDCAAQLCEVEDIWPSLPPSAGPFGSMYSTEPNLGWRPSACCDLECDKGNKSFAGACKCLCEPGYMGDRCDDNTGSHIRLMLVLEVTNRGTVGPREIPLLLDVVAGLTEVGLSGIEVNSVNILESGFRRTGGERALLQDTQLRAETVIMDTAVKLPSERQTIRGADSLIFAWESGALQREMNLALERRLAGTAGMESGTQDPLLTNLTINLATFTRGRALCDDSSICCPCNDTDPGTAIDNSISREGQGDSGPDFLPWLIPLCLLGAMITASLLVYYRRELATYLLLRRPRQHHKHLHSPSHIEKAELLRQAAKDQPQVSPACYRLGRARNMISESDIGGGAWDQVSASFNFATMDHTIRELSPAPPVLFDPTEKANPPSYLHLSHHGPVVSIMASAKKQNTIKMGRRPARRQVPTPVSLSSAAPFPTLSPLFVPSGNVQGNFQKADGCRGHAA
eukprot:481168-Rhodomonas_salina.1